MFPHGKHGFPVLAEISEVRLDKLELQYSTMYSTVLYPSATVISVRVAAFSVKRQLVIAEENGIRQAKPAPGLSQLHGYDGLEYIDPSNSSEHSHPEMRKCRPTAPRVRKRKEEDDEVVLI